MTAAYNVPRHHANVFAEQVKQTPTPNDPGFAKEVFHRLYAESPNELPAVNGNLARRKLHSLVSELPEFEALRHATTRDPLWASIATVAMGKAVARQVPVDPNADQANKILAGLQEMQAESPTPEAFDKALSSAYDKRDLAVFKDQDNATAIDETAARQALRAGIGQAVADIEQAEEALGMLGYGIGQNGSPNTASSPDVALELARRVKSSPTLAEIIALAGRLISTARAKKAARSEYARSEVVGVELTNDVSHLLGSEIALLADEDMADDLLIRLTERRALGYKMRGKEKLAKGPIILMLDQSGSMNGPKDVWAKAIALALYDTARSEKRAFGIVTYDGGVREAYMVETPEMMLEAISSKADGASTKYDAAMTCAQGMCKLPKADIVHLTDGDARYSAAEAALKSAEALGVRIYGIGIGKVGPALAAWSHQSTQIADVTKDTAAMDLIFGEGGI